MIRKLPFLFLLPATMFADTPREEGIPVNDQLVIAKCGTCHTRDEQGNMQRISWERATPEAWEEALKRMIRANGVVLTGPEARSIIKYLSADHGLAPEEARPVMYSAERRVYKETGVVIDNLKTACGKCHNIARSLSWRRSLEDWKQFATAHLERYKAQPNEEAVAFLARTAPLRSPEWTAWSARMRAAKLTGRWRVTAYMPGRGMYFGEMDVQSSGAGDEFNTRVNLQSVRDGSTIVRTGHSLLFGGYAWRGRSKGSAASSAADDLSSEMREVMWFAPDQSRGEGRWFWGEYQELGFDVKLQRPSSEPALTAIDRTSLKTGSQGNRIRLIGDNFPVRVAPSDLEFGPGVTTRVVSRSPSEIVVEVDVAADAMPGKRDVALRHSALAGAVAIYDRVDYIKVVPESALAAYAGQTRPRGYQQFEAIGFQRGPDGKLHTADDLELGPVDVTWSMQEFYASDGASTEMVGTLSASGFFTPASENPKRNYDVWVIATATNDKDKKGKPLVGKSYLVVTPPTYTFNGRQYVRDLDRWIEDAGSRGNQ